MQVLLWIFAGLVLLDVAFVLGMLYGARQAQRTAFQSLDELTEYAKNLMRELSEFEHWK